MDVSARSQDTFGAGYHERIAHSKTTHDHALRRGTYRSKRRRGGGAFSGWRLALPSGLFALILATGALLLIGGGAALAYFTGDLPSPQDLAKEPLAQSTKVYDRTGTQLLYQFSEENREVVSYEEIPQVLIDATVAAEDKSFFSNPGVDVLGIVRAVVSDLTGRGAGQGGASTITQQLVKRRIVGDEVSLKRKIREAILAIEVTNTYSKQQILELYFNQIYYGQQAYGVKAAAQTYFGKSDLSKLTLAEAALLAGLPQSPSILDPTQAENADRAQERRLYVLNQMVDTGAITQDAADAANAEPITVAGPPVATIKAPHFVFQVRNQLTQILGGGKADPTRMSPSACGYCPENADLQYHGPVTMRQAIRESRNVPAVRFLAEYSGIEATIQTAHDLGITTEIDPSKIGLSLTLGAKEVHLVDMASAYGVLANMGVRVTPTFILKVEDSHGKVIWEHKDYEQKRALDAGIAWIMTDILKDTTNPAKDFIFGQWTNIGRVAALKTGTTDNLKDVYSVGYVPTMVTGVWMGNSNGLPMSSVDFSSAMGPGQLWRDYMKEALADTPVTDWPRPANVVSGNVVSAPGALGGYGSGLAPSALSPFSSTEWFIKGTEPAKADDWVVAGCPQPDGTAKIAMSIKDTRAPAAFQRYTDQWIRDAMAGKHAYGGRYAWNLVGPDPCPTPSPSPTPTRTPVPTRTPGPTSTIGFPTGTLPPFPTPKKTP